MNPAFVVNQTGQNQQVYLNPNFRYAGNSDTPGSWRSQSLPFAANGMAVGDLDGDGRNEVVLFSNSEVYVYRRHEQFCLVCGSPIVKEDLAGRNLYWCPSCQR